MRREFVRLGGMVLVPVRMNIPQVLKAEWIWEIAARDSGEEKESEVKRGAQWMTGTWLIPSDGPCFVGMEEEGPKGRNSKCALLIHDLSAHDAVYQQR